MATITLANSGGTCALANSTAGTLTIAGITNPTVANSYAANTFSVATSKDTAAASPSAAVVINPATAAKLAYATAPPASTTAGTSFSVVVNEEDTYNNIETGDSTTTLSLAANNGGGGFSCTTSPSKFTSGVATFSGCSYTVASATAYTLTASSGSLTSATATTTVGAATAATIAISSGSGQSATVNTSFTSPLAAKVTDNYANPVSGATVTFTAPGSGASGTFLATTNGGTCLSTGGSAVASCTATTNSSGVASSLTYKANTTAATYNVAVTSSGTTPNPLNFPEANTATTAAKLAYATAPPASTTAGTSFSVVVNEEDTYNNIETGDSTTTLSLAANNGGGGFSCTTSPSKFTSGVATFSGCSYTVASATAYTLTASSGSLTSATATTTVSAATAATIAISSGSGQSATVNTSFTSPLAAKVTDNYANPVSGATVTFTAPGSGASGTFLATTNGGTCLSTGGSAVASCTATTNSSGVASSLTYKANTTAATYNVAVTSSGTTPNPLNFPETNTATTAAKLAYATAPPASTTAGTSFSVVVNEEDTYNNIETGDSTTTLSLAANNGGGGFSCTTSPSKFTSGVATFSGCSYTVASATAYTLTASSGSLTSATATTTVSAATAATIAISSGSGQSATVNTSFTSPLAAKVTDNYANPVSGATVTFTAPGSGASGTFLATTNGGTCLSTGGSAVASCTATTNSSGVASSLTYKANTTAATYNVAVTSSGTTPNPLNFPEANSPGTAYYIVVSSGSGQSATVNTSFTSPLAAKVTDNYANPVSGATVTFTAPGSGASGTFLATTNGGTCLSTGGSAVASCTATTNSSGVASSLTYKANTTAATYNVAVTSSGTTPNPLNFPETNTATTAAKLVFVQGPSNVSAGAPMSPAVTVQVEDTYGNPASDSGVLVTLISSPSVTLSGNTATSSSSGLATFSSLVIDTAGNYTLSGTDGSLAATGASGSFTVSAATPNQLAFVQQPSNAFAGQAMTPAVTVQVEDYYGNAVADNDVSITLTPSANTIASGATINTDSSGLATFSGITINTAALGLTLTASASGLWSPTSSSFNVTIAVSNGATLTDAAADAESGVQSVSYYYCSGYSGSCTNSNWTLIGTSTSGRNYSITWTGQPSDGAYRVVAVGIDNVTNTSNPSASIPVTVDNNGTTATMSFPTNGGNYNAAGWTSGAPIAGTANDTTSGIRSVQVSVQEDGGTNSCWTGSGNNFTAACPSYQATSGTTANWTEAFPSSNFASDGSYTVTAEAISIAGTISTVAHTFIYDTTPPTGAITYTNGYDTTTSLQVIFSASDGTGSGVNSSSGQLMRASATLSNNSCGAFGSYSDIGPPGVTSPYNDTVANGSCYQYEYVVSDNAGNPATVTSASTVKVDTTAPTAPSLSFSALTSAYWSGTGTTVYFKGGSSGGFTLTPSSTDPETGIANYNYPSLGSGWSQSAGVYSFTAAATTGTGSVTATNSAGLTGSGTSFTAQSDTTAPTGGAVTVNGTAAASGGSTSSTTSTSFPINARTDYTDSGSGLASSALTVQSETFTNNACGAPGSGGPFTTATTITGTTQPSGITTGYCYLYKLTGTDNVGNTASISTTVQVVGAATQLVFSTQPTVNQIIQATGTGSFPVTVAVEDASGNTETGLSSGSVTLAIGTNPSSGVLTCTGGLTVTVSSGLASFTGCAITKAGTGYTLRASDGSLTPPTNADSFNITAGTAANIAITSGAGQPATVGAAFANPLVATVTDVNGNPVSGVSVTFTAPGSGASGTFANSTVTTSATTGSTGQATSSTFTANTVAGSYVVSATAPSTNVVNFAETNNAGSARTIAVSSGSGQSATVSTAFTNPLVALVTDTYGNPVSGVTVTFTPPGSGASGTFAGGVNTAVTNASGLATSVTFTANATSGGPYNITASASGTNTVNFSETNKGNIVLIGVCGLTITSSTSDPTSSANTACSAAAEADGNSITLHAPSTVTVGDVLIAEVTARDPAAPSAPSGWTQIPTTNQGATNGTSNSGSGASYYNNTIFQYVYYHVVVSGDSSGSTWTWTWSGGAQSGAADATGGVLEFSGVSPTTPVDVSGYTYTSGGTAGKWTVATAPAVTTTKTNDEIIALFSAGGPQNFGSATFAGQQDGATSDYSAQSDNSAGSGIDVGEYESNAAAVTTTSVQASAGSTGTFTLTQTASTDAFSWIASTIALEPA